MVKNGLGRKAGSRGFLIADLGRLDQHVSA